MPGQLVLVFFFIRFSFVFFFSLVICFGGVSQPQRPPFAAGQPPSPIRKVAKVQTPKMFPMCVHNFYVSDIYTSKYVYIHIYIDTTKKYSTNSI